MRRIVLTLACVLSLLLASSCVEKVDPIVDESEVFVIYQLVYKAEDGKTYARVTFRSKDVFGFNLQLNAPGKISFEGEELPFLTGFNYYEKEIPGLVSKGTFTYVDTKGNSYQNEVTLDRINFPGGLSTIDPNQGIELVWSGDKLRPDESVLLTLKHQDLPLSESFTQSITDSDRFILTPQDLKSLGSGKVIMEMERLYAPDIQEHAGAGGQIGGSYLPQPITVTFK